MASRPSTSRKQAFNEQKARQELLFYLRKVGVKLNAFLKAHSVWREPKETYEEIFQKDRQGRQVPLLDSYSMDIKETIGYDRPLRLIAELLLLEIRKLRPRPQFVIGLEATGWPLTAAIITLNDVLFPRERLRACYIRKKKKKTGLARQFEGARNLTGQRAVLVDDLLNRGHTLQLVRQLARDNDFELAGAFFVLDNDLRRRERQKSETDPADAKPPLRHAALFQLSEVLDPKNKTPENQRYYKKYPFKNQPREKPTLARIKKDPLADQDLLNIKENKTLTRSDIELVRLVKDTITMGVLSGYKTLPTLNPDGRGSFGYLPFLGHYLKDRGGVFVRINKREYRNQTWHNRMRGCMSANLRLDRQTVAESAIQSALLTAQSSLKITPDQACSTCHKPIWPEELGSLSYFVFVIEKIVPTRARSARQLKQEGHDIKKHGLMAQQGDYSGTILGGLDYILNIPHQMKIATGKMSNGRRFRTHSVNEVKFSRIFGRWLWLPERPMKYYFY